MSCGPTSTTPRAIPPVWWRVLADEGFRLFFPLAALYAALCPAMWVLALGFDLPLARDVPPSLWHAHEMLVGAFGAALIGFITTAAPEWTDTEPPRGRALLGFAALWGVGRCVGFLGWEGLGLIGALADLGWMVALLVFLIQLSWSKQTDRLLAFVFWLSILTGCTAAARVGFFMGDIDMSSRAIHLIGLANLGLLGLALGRITVPVTNLVLDPSELTSPFRPHPGRLHLASGLVFVAMAGELIGLSPAASGFLFIAAGAAFMDRVSEAFIGRPALRGEILMLAGASLLAGAGLMMAGAARLGAPWSEVAGLHVAFMGGLGLGVYAVFCIAGLLHTNRPLDLPNPVRIGVLCLVLSVALRFAPEFGGALPGPVHGLAVAGWSSAFLVWLITYWPMVSRMAAPAEADIQGGNVVEFADPTRPGSDRRDYESRLR